MATILEKFCELYTQDFDLVFEQDTDPVDLFCQQHSVQDQMMLLRQLRDFYEGVLVGRKSIRHLASMGLEYIPGNDRDPKVWLPPLIEYLERKIAGGPSQSEHS